MIRVIHLGPLIAIWDRRFNPSPLFLHDQPPCQNNLYATLNTRQVDTSFRLYRKHSRKCCKWPYLNLICLASKVTPKLSIRFALQVNKYDKVYFWWSSMTKTRKLEFVSSEYNEKFSCLGRSSTYLLICRLVLIDNKNKLNYCHPNFKSKSYCLTHSVTHFLLTLQFSKT